MTEHTGYPTVSGYDEFLYEPDKPLQRRPHRLRVQPARRAGVRHRAVGPVQARSAWSGRRSSCSTTSACRARDLVKLAWWDKDENERPLLPAVAAVRCTRSSAHVEIGGIDPRVRHLEPAAARARRGCARRRRRCSCASPRSRRASASRASIARRSPAASRASTSSVENEGYLGTYGVPSAKELDFNEPLYATREGASSSIRARRTSCSATSTAGATACTPARTCPRIPGTRGIDERGVGDLPRARAAGRSTSASAVRARASSPRASRCRRTRPKSRRSRYNRGNGAVRDRRHPGLHGQPRAAALADRASRRRAISSGSSAISSTAGRARSTCCAGRASSAPSSRPSSATTTSTCSRAPPASPGEKKRDTLDDVLAARDLRSPDRLAARAAAGPRRGPRTSSCTPASIPRWTADKARALGAEIEAQLRGPTWRAFLAPAPRASRRAGDDELGGGDRWRAILAYLMRARMLKARRPRRSPTTTAHPRRRAQGRRAVVQVPRARVDDAHRRVRPLGRARPRHRPAPHRRSTPAACGASR